MLRWVLFCVCLAVLASCKGPSPEPLSIEQLQFPDPERDAIAANGIKQITGIYLSPEQFNGDTASVNYYDSLGNVLFSNIVSPFGQRTNLWYNILGLEVVESQVTDFGEEILHVYSFVPEERIMFENIIHVGYMVITRVWQFDNEGRVIKRFNAAEMEVYEYDSFGRLSQITTSFDAEMYEEFDMLGPYQLISLYEYQSNTNLLSKIKHTYIDKNGAKMTQSIIQTYTDKGLPYQVVYSNGSITQYEVFTETEWKRTASLPQLP